jgi:Uma2 family endonuclease
MSITINPPAGHWTIDDLDRIEADGYRVELHEGNLVIMSPATAWHSVVILRLANALLAMGLPAITEIGVKRSGRDLRVADIAVFREAVTDLDIAFWAPGDIATVIEVVSESSELDDRVTKPLWYAEVGIPEYWRVERSEDRRDAVIFQFELATTANGKASYVQTAVTTLTALEAQAQGSNL